MIDVVFAVMYLCMPKRRAEVIRWTGQVNVFIGCCLLIIFAFVLVLYGVADAVKGV